MNAWLRFKVKLYLQRSMLTTFESLLPSQNQVRVGERHDLVKVVCVERIASFDFHVVKQVLITNLLVAAIKR